jgi:hypothetical protein
MGVGWLNAFEHTRASSDDAGGLTAKEKRRDGDYPWGCSSGYDVYASQAIPTTVKQLAQLFSTELSSDVIRCAIGFDKGKVVLGRGIFNKIHYLSKPAWR